jgi:hypothetical protein
VLLLDIDDDTVFIVDALESGRNADVPAPSRTMSKDRTTNQASLALARLAYRELVDDYTDNSLAFLTTEDADFVRTAARAAKEEAEVDTPFSIVYRGKQMTCIPSHWIELISARVKRSTCTKVPYRSNTW